MFGNSNSKPVSRTYVDSTLGDFLRRDGTNSATANINLNSNKLTNVLDPTNNQDAVTKNYADNAFLRKDGTITTDLDLNSHKIINVLDPTNNQDVATKKYADTTKVSKTGDTMTGDLLFTGVGTVGGVRNLGSKTAGNQESFNLWLGSDKVRLVHDTGTKITYLMLDPTSGLIIKKTNGTVLLNIGMNPNPLNAATFVVAIDMTFKPIVNVLDPVNNQDAATKKYVDTALDNVASNISYNTPLLTLFANSDHAFISSFSETLDSKKPSTTITYLNPPYSLANNPKSSELYTLSNPPRVDFATTNTGSHKFLMHSQITSGTEPGQFNVVVYNKQTGDSVWTQSITPAVERTNDNWYISGILPLEEKQEYRIIFNIISGNPTFVMNGVLTVAYPI